MNLTWAGKSIQGAVVLAARSHVLLINSEYDISAEKINQWLARPTYGMVLLSGDDQTPVGIADWTWCPEHRRVEINLFSEGSLESCIKAICMTAVQMGAIKINMLVECVSSSVSEAMRKLGFTPEVRLRQHALIHGRLTNMVMYGISAEQIRDRAETSR